MARKRIQRFRYGAEEKKLVGKLVQATKAFKIYVAEKKKHETTFNKRLVKKLKKVVAEVEGDLKKNDIKLVSESFRPDLAVPGDGAHPLLAVECKKLRGNLAKRNFKEGMSQALIYRLKYKVVMLVLYDFTKAGRYWKHFKAGNRLESRMAARFREQMRFHIIVLKPQPGGTP